MLHQHQIKLKNAGQKCEGTIPQLGSFVKALQESLPPCTREGFEQISEG